MASLDHLVLEVRDPVASTAFYRDVLGLAPVRLAAFQAGEAPFPSLRVSRGTLVDLMPPRMWAGRRPRNPGHFCLAVSAAQLGAVRRRLARRGIRLTRVAARNFGARGYARSIYFDDPDGTSVEVRAYPRARRRVQD